jgi:hypothetical protein
MDLRGLSQPPSVIGLSASTATLGNGRNVNLPTLKNPQGELLNLSELAGASDGLSEYSFNVSKILAMTASLCTIAL